MGPDNVRWLLHHPLARTPTNDNIYPEPGRDLYVGPPNSQKMANSYQNRGQMGYIYTPLSE